MVALDGLLQFVDVVLVEMMCHLNPHPLKTKGAAPKSLSRGSKIFAGLNLVPPREKVGTELSLCFCVFDAQNELPS